MKRIVCLFLTLICFFNIVSCKKTKEDKGVFLGDPIVVAQGPSFDEVGWGPWQFPEIYVTEDGKVVVTLAMGLDSHMEYEVPKKSFISSDGGVTWNVAEDVFLYGEGYTAIMMENGNGFVGFKPKNAYDASFLDKYTAKNTFGTYSLYLADEVPEFSQEVIAKEYNPLTKEVNEFTVKINWPYMPINRLNNLCMPLDAYFALITLNGITKLSDGSLLAVMYSGGYNAENGKLASFGAYDNVYLFRSIDCGRTWDYYSQILATPEFTTFGGEGFTEPSISKMPDGSYVVLMRTGTGRASYIAYSTDNGKTWTKPTSFDKVGVLPKIVSLKCGVTLASYGRPGVYLRWTTDRSAQKWEDPIDLGISTAKEETMTASCCYTSMVALSDTEALIVYTDFQYPSLKDASKKVKTTLVRKITVKL